MTERTVSLALAIAPHVAPAADSTADAVDRRVAPCRAVAAATARSSPVAAGVAVPTWPRVRVAAARV